jgi:hypothetical protein
MELYLDRLCNHCILLTEFYSTEAGSTRRDEMKEKHFEMNMQEKEDIFRRIEQYLDKRSDLLFTYVHGDILCAWK